MKNNKSIPRNIDLAIEVNKPKEVDEWGWGRVHKDDSEDNDIQWVHIAEAVDIVGSILAVVPELCVLLVGEVDVHDFRHNVACFEQTWKNGQSQFVHYVDVVEESIRTLVD